MGKVRVNGSLLFTDEPCEQPEREDTVNRELITFIFDKMKAAGLRPLDLAKRFVNQIFLSHQMIDCSVYTELMEADHVYR